MREMIRKIPSKETENIDNQLETRLRDRRAAVVGAGFIVGLMMALVLLLTGWSSTEKSVSTSTQNAGPTIASKSAERPIEKAPPPGSPTPHEQNPAGKAAPRTNTATVPQIPKELTMFDGK